MIYGDYHPSRGGGPFLFRRAALCLLTSNLLEETGRGRSCHVGESRLVGCVGRTPSYPCVQSLCPSSQLASEYRGEKKLSGSLLALLPTCHREVRRGQASYSPYGYASFVTFSVAMILRIRGKRNRSVLGFGLGLAVQPPQRKKAGEVVEYPYPVQGDQSRREPFVSAERKEQRCHGNQEHDYA